LHPLLFVLFTVSGTTPAGKHWIFTPSICIAFSDGVYAIVITLLILDIRIPDVPPAALGGALIHMLPQVLTYILSFFVVGLYWVAHHRVSHQVKQIDGTFVWLNLV
jgi:uncharacterized membrane protein